MKRRVEPSNGSKSDTDRAKRVYRAALESIKCLESINKGQKAYREVFRQDAVGLRNKLKDYCERLMFYNPVEYGRKAEEVLWRKVFYDVIQVVKRNKDHVRRHGSVETAYRTHLAAAIGYYQHLLFRLQREFSLRLAGVIDYYLLQDQRPGRRGDTGSVKPVNPSVQEWAQRACHRCLICLGDVLRYICDVDHMAIPTTAERYYHQAFILFPEIGMPHNQLGTLAGSRYCGCEAAYHYMRCLACEKPFEGARGNLSRLFEKNAKRFYDLNKQGARDQPPGEQKSQDIKRFLTRFLKLLEIFHGGSPNMEMSELQELCQHTLQDFNLCMFYEPQHQMPTADCGDVDDPLEDGEEADGSGDPGDPISFLYLDNGIVFKIVCCLMCTIQLLEKTGSINVTAAMAFLLALFSHILNHVLMRLQARMDDLQHPNKILLAGSALSKENLQANDSSGSDEEVSKKVPQDNNGNISSKHASMSSDTKKSRPTRIRNLRRRRKRRQLSDSSEDAMSDWSDMSDLSEGKAEAEDQLVSSESDDDDLASYFDRGSDSDLSDTEECSQPTEPNNTRPQGGSTWPSSGHALPNGDLQHIWSNGVDNSGLAHMSSELFSSSLMFLGQDLANNPHASEMSQGNEEVPVPPGFMSSLEAKHVAEITEKLANFEIETDTETNFFPTDTEQSGNLTETDEADNEQSSSSNTEKQEMGQRKLQHRLEAVQAEGLLPTVKVMCDWMRGQVSIISVCAQSSHTLWQRLSLLLNFLPHENELSHHDVCWVQELQLIATQTRFSDWAQGFPLTEDIEMCQLPSLAEVHGQIDFTIRHRAQLTDMQETFLRICCLRRFGYFLTAIEGIDFCYQPETALFLGPSVDSNLPASSQDTMEKMKDTESRRNQLMRDMAQLRLQAEVRELEGSLKTSDQQVFPPYVLVDDAALCRHLTKVKELAATARCILVIPLAVVDSLDMKKKECTSAREVIRWLEVQLRKGNRYIRAQKNQETLLSQQHGILKKKNRDSWYILELLGCARYLAQQTGTFTGNNSVVVILTGEHKLLEPPLLPVIQQVRTSAQQEGVSVETVTEFIARWKSFLQQPPEQVTGDG
ncbi:protein SMG5 [Aplysia californica]|uniref:Protein SMG5 n=1 Tax=Aplysia californica TaxID=6500 RepID=A0ABM0K6S7_APLCA|nr:protein SMG5 [Aplysia californica]